MNQLERLQQEVMRLRGELREAEECIQAIHDGRVDAFVVGGSARERVYLLESIDGPFRILVEHMQQGAVTIAADGTVLYVNERFSALVGRPRERLIGQPFRRFVVRADRALFEALVSGDVERPQGELRLLRADDSSVSVYLSAEPLSQDGGETCLVVTDLTQQKQHEELIEAGTLARSVVEQAPEIVVVCDPDGTVVLASPPAHEVCGRNPLWQSFPDVFPVALPEPSSLAPRGLFQPPALDDQVRNLEVSLACAGDEPLPLLLCASPVRDSQGACLGSVVTLADIAALKRAENELKEADRRKDEFLAMLAHELRNPLAPIVSGLEVLRLSGGTDEPTAPVFRMLQRQVDQLVRLVDDLLEISRIARGKIELRKEVVKLADVLNDALETSRPLIEAMQHELEVDVPGETVWIECDGVRLSQVIANLLNNAAKYTPRGGRISLRAKVVQDELVVRVRDTGYGIDPDALHSVFEMFIQSRLASRAESGLGVGLALVRTLVEMHGGSVSAASEGRGRGSEFTVRLPLGHVPERHPGDDDEPAVAHANLERILIVDDNRDSADSLGMLLDLLHYDVRVAFDGRAALEELDRFDAQAVFLDIDMPGMDGYDVARRIRARPELAGIVLVAVTGWGQNHDRAMSREAGFDHHLLKPVALEELRAVLAAAAARQAAKDEALPEPSVTRH